MSIEQSIIQASRRFSIVIVDGPRANNKKELVTGLFPDKQYVSLSNDRYLNLLKESPESFFLAFNKGAVIDEAQLDCHLIHSLIHQITKSGYCPGKFVIIYNGLAEYEDSQNITARITYIPEVVSYKTPFEMILNGFIPDNNKLLCDASLKLNVSNKEKFLSFLKLCATMNGGQFSSGLVAEKLNISVPTALSWFDILIKLGTVIQIKASDIKLGIKPFSKPLFVFSSPAYVCKLLGINTVQDLILSEYLEKIVFSFAVLQLMKYRFDQGLPGNIAYFKDRNNPQALLVAEWKHRWIFSPSAGLEANHNKALGLNRFKTKLSDPDSKTAMLYLGELTMSFEKTEWISYLDWKKLAYGVNYYS